MANDFYTRLFCIQLFLLSLLPRATHSQVPQGDTTISLRFEAIGHEDGMPEHRVFEILEDHLGLIWLGTPRGLLKYNGYGFESYQYEPEDSVLAARQYDGMRVHILTEGPTGDLWIGSGFEWPDKPAIFRFDRETEKIIPYLFNPQDSLPPIHSGITSIQEDGRYIWVSSMQKESLIRIRPEEEYLNAAAASKAPFEWISAEHGLLPDERIYHILKDKKGRLWLGGTQGLYLWHPEQDNFQYFESKAMATFEDKYCQLTGIEEGPDGKLWIHTHRCGGFFSFDPENQQYRHHPMSGQLDIMPDDQGKVWIAGFAGRGGIGWYDERSGKLANIDIRPDGLDFFPVARVREYLQDRSGMMWVGTMEGPLLKYNPQRAAFHWLKAEPSNPNSLSHNWVTDIDRDAAGNYWIATFGGGLNRWNPETDTFTHYNDGPNSEVDLNYPYVLDLTIDDQGKVWYGFPFTATFDPKSQKVQQFRERGGSINSLYTDSRGQVWIGQYRSLGKYLPVADSFKDHQVILPETPNIRQAVNKIAVSPKLIFTKMDVFGEPLAIGGDSPLQKHISVTREIELQHWQNDLTLHYAALHYKNPANNRYKVKLDNYDEQWREVGTQRAASYTNLDPGRYTFRVIAANSDGIWNEEGIALDIAIRPPWYWNGWSQALYLVLIISLILGVYRFQLNRRLALAEAARLKELDSFKTRLYTNITHEFRTPLTVIQGMAGQITGFEEERDAINRNSQSLLNLINRMLGLSKLEAGKLELNLVQDDILPFLRYVTESFHSYALNQKVNLNFYTDAEGIVMDYDPEKVLEVLSNLLSNALKFTPEYGKVQVVVKEKNREGEPHLELTVSDTGIGIAKEQLPYIFDRFYSPPQSPRRGEVPAKGLSSGPSTANPPPSGGLGGAGTGAGIGLALVKELIDLMDGKIEVESEVSKGTSFRLILPITRQADAIDDPTIASIVSTTAPAERASSARHSEAKEGTSFKYTLLLVEDNRDVMQYLTTCLKNDYHLLYARNGHEGIAQALEHIPDIIISDVMMPEADGFELCKTLKQDERTSHIPIILLTARADMESKLEGLEYGADAYLVKPFQKEELEVRLRKLIELRRKLQERYNQPDFQPEPATQKEDAFVLKVKELLLENLDDDTFGIEELSEALHLSRVHLHRKLKALTGKPTSHFIRQVRLQEGHKLLKEGELNVSEVAYRVGYKDPGYFSKLFAEVYGKPPSEV